MVSTDVSLESDQSGFWLRALNGNIWSTLLRTAHLHLARETRQVTRLFKYWEQWNILGRPATWTGKYWRLSLLSSTDTDVRRSPTRSKLVSFYTAENSTMGPAAFPVYLFLFCITWSSHSGSGAVIWDIMRIVRMWTDVSWNVSPPSSWYKISR
jgi:hypothetical protein